jgi:hypothetical protein
LTLGSPNTCARFQGTLAPSGVPLPVTAWLVPAGFAGVGAARARCHATRINRLNN